MAYPLKVWDGTQWVQVSTSTQSNYAFATLNRWRKTMSGGEVSLSGTDDSGLPLTYTAGEEQLFLNGTLLARGADYTATNGTDVVNLAPLVSGDVLEVHSRTMQNIANTYTQAQADSRFVNRSVGGLNLVIPTGATNGTVSANGAVTVGSAVSSVTVNGAFSATYDNYRIFYSGGVGSQGAPLTIAFNGSSSNTYYETLIYATAGVNTPLAATSNGVNYFTWGGNMSTTGLHMNLDLLGPFLARPTMYSTTYTDIAVSGAMGRSQGFHNQSVSYTAFTIAPTAGTLTGGTIRIYGYNNGA